MKKSATVDACVDELEKAGVRHTVTWTSKHVHIHFGPELQHLHVSSATPSDWRAPINERAQIRRELRSYGLLGTDSVDPRRELIPVQLVDGEPVCASQDIAESFGKAHKDVLRAIDRVREECGREFDQRNFAPIEYLDARGREQRAFQLTRDGFSLVVMGFTGAEATAWKVKYIAAFNAMADEISKLAAPTVDLTGIQRDIDALVTLVADIEAKASAPQLPATRQIPSFAHLPRILQRKMMRRERRRLVA